jgi:hypothetical protein
MPEEHPAGGFWPDWLTPRRAAEFIRNVVRLENAMRQIQQEGRELHSEVARLQSQVTEQNAKLQVLVDFVRQTLTERIDTRTELTVRRILDRRSDETHE